MGHGTEIAKHREKPMPLRTFIIVLAAALVLWTAPAAAQELSTGQTLYVPAYSHIYQGAKSKPFNLTCTLSVRNTSFTQPVKLTVVDYYDDLGDHVRRYLDKPRQLGPMESASFVVDQADTTAGSGAKFIVVWESDEPVDPIYVESIMIGTHLGQGISYRSTSQVIHPAPQDVIGSAK